MPDKRKILFVCTGNSCRSPMAEYLLRMRLGPNAAKWEISSAGTNTFPGMRASQEAVTALSELGVDLRPHRTHLLTYADLADTELVVVMTQWHKDDLLRRFPTMKDKVFLIHSFGSANRDADVSDPIGATLAVYRRVRDEIDAALADLILYLHQKETINAPSVSEKKGEIKMKIAIGADHGGFALKEHLIGVLRGKGLTVEDVGCHSRDSVDYPEYAAMVARQVADGDVDQGILICTTGIGMSIAANRFPRVRAAICTNDKMAKMARLHNNANILVLGAAIVSPEEAVAIWDTWAATEFDAGGRHERRLDKVVATCGPFVSDPNLVYEQDPEIYAAIRAETKRQKENLELIASENYVSRSVREAMGSVMTNKYAEGYPGKRWYNGCEFVDDAERLAIDRAKQLFGAEHANVQPHSGSQANMAVYFAMLQPGDTILAMSLAEGGHLTHGNKANFSGRFFNVIPYGVKKETETINYDGIQALAEEHKPKMIVAGASAYSRIIDFKRLRQIADSVGALLMVDMAHIAGLVAAGCHPSPVPYSHFVTTTTHKTLRGPRGGMILCEERFAADIDRQIFPGIQGGPLMHVVAAKAVCFHEALMPEFKDYQEQIVKNAQALASALQRGGLRIVSGGTDNHLFLVDLNPFDLSGKDAATALDKACITVNKNAVPFDTRSPFVTSGIRVGTPAITTRGMKLPEMDIVAELMLTVLKNWSDGKVVAEVREKVLALTDRFPVP